MLKLDSINSNPNNHSADSIRTNLLQNLQNNRLQSSKLDKQKQTEAIIDALNISVPIKKSLKKNKISSNRGIYGHIETIKDWKRALKENWREWLSTTKIVENKESNPFYQAFNRWKNKQTEDKKERNRLKNELFPNKYGHLETIEDWKMALKENWREWLSTGEITKNKRSRPFYRAFNNWKNKQTEDSKERDRLKNELFPNKYWQLTTIDNWKRALKENWREWLSTGEMTKNNESANFYSAFTRWKNEQTKSRKERDRLKALLFPDQKAPLYYTFKGNLLRFDSASERKCAVILSHLGMIDNFVEWKNLHVRTNGRSLHSVDFKIWSVFLEYHPAQRWHNFDSWAKKKHKYIKDPQYKGLMSLYVFDDIYELYDIIKNDKSLIKHIPQDKLIYLTHPDEFQRLLDNINKEIVKYDKHNKHDSSLSIEDDLKEAA